VRLEIAYYKIPNGIIWSSAVPLLVACLYGELRNKGIQSQLQLDISCCIIYCYVVWLI